MVPFRLSTLLATALVTGALAFPAIAADAPAKLTVVLNFIPNVEMFGPEYALHEGFFKVAGLDVTLVTAGPGINPIQMVAAGSAQIGQDAAETILIAVDKGVEVKIIGAQFQKSPIAMTCRKDSGIATPAQVVGKKVGVKVAAKNLFDLFMKKVGVDIAQVQTTPIGNADIAFVIAGRTDCQFTTFVVNEPRSIEKAGVPVNVFPIADYGLNSQANSYFVRGDFYADPANRKILSRYLAALGKAWAVFMQDPQKAARYMVDKAFVEGLDLDQQLYQADQQALFMKGPLTAEKGILWIDPAVFAQTAKNAFDAGSTSKLVDTSTVVTTEILAETTLPKF